METETDVRALSPLDPSQPPPPEYWPPVEHLVTEDDAPMDNIFSEKQLRLLTEPLYSSWKPDVPFLALANVGLFHSAHRPPYVPDMLLSLETEAPADLFPKSHRSYFVWEYGKPPDLVVEVVSNREGKEDSEKLKGYARIAVSYYLVFDPELWLSPERLRLYELQTGNYKLKSGESHVLDRIGLGVKLWSGKFEGHQDDWLRWTDMEGNLIATGAERAETERERAETERVRADEAFKRAEKLAEQLRRLGVSPEE